jgi:hypothetical protein
MVWSCQVVQWVVGTLALLLWGGAPAAAGQGAPIDLELVLAIDTSGSVDPWEFGLQIRGLAAAFRDPVVQAAIAGSTPNGLAVALVQWSGAGEQLATAGWALVRDRATAADFARQIETSGRQFMGRTAIAGALHFATDLILRNPYDGARKVIDLSGDGRSNDGPDPGPARDAALLADITINGLAVTTDRADLGHYFRERVIGGPDAFVVTAQDYEDFVRAIRIKLLREIGGTPIGDAGPRTIRPAMAPVAPRRARGGGTKQTAQVF